MMLQPKYITVLRFYRVKGEAVSKRLYKIEEGRKIFGVCGGLAEYIDMDVVLVRILWVVFSLVYGVGIILYLALAFVLPKKSDVES